MTYIIAEPCIGVKDRACVEVCPVDCIYEYVEDVGAFVVPDPSTGAGPDKQVIPRGEATHVPPETGITKEQLKAQLFIHPEECIDCGACVPVCPVSAIFVLDELPEKWAGFAARNAAYYGL